MSREDDAGRRLAPLQPHARSYLVAIPLRTRCRLRRQTEAPMSMGTATPPRGRC
jgi:hypothetical protein